MIPLKLQLKNFLSYGSDLQTVSFEPYHLICFSGRNGHGKSALLDAITWALWGQARKPSGTVKPDISLLRLGQTQMMVVFDFLFNKKKYRIKREFALIHSKPWAQLEFGEIDPNSQNIIPLTDKTIRTTQETIERTLNLSFESFVNSSFLRQGHANEFSQKSPKDRKEILADILGLGQFEIIKRRALEHTKKSELERKTLSQFQEKYQEELKKEEEVIQKQAEIKEIIAVYKQDYTALQKQEQELQALKEESQKHTLLFEQKKIALQQYDDTSAEKKETVRSLINEWRTIHRKRKKLAQKNLLLKQKKELEQVIQLQQQNLQKALVFKDSYVKLKEEVDKQEQEHVQKKQQLILEIGHNLERVNYDKQAVENTHKEFESALKRITIERAQFEKEQKELKGKTAQIQKELKNAHHLQETFDKAKDTYYRWVALAGTYKESKQELCSKKELIEKNNNPSCPLCTQIISKPCQDNLITQLTSAIAKNDHASKRLTKVIPLLKNKTVNLHAQLKKMQLLSQDHARAQAQIDERETAQQAQHVMHSEYTQKLIELKEQIVLSEKQKATLKKELKAAQEIKLPPESVQKKKELDALIKELKNIAYDKKTHESAQTEFETINKSLEQAQEIAIQLHYQNERMKQIEVLGQQIKKIMKDAHQLKEEVNKLSEESKEKKLSEKEKELKLKRNELLERKEQIVKDQAMIHASEQRIAAIKKELSSQTKKLETLQSTIHDYQLIAQATGKDGIQALLIEQAIPEIEQEANDLLSRLTQNQAQLFIESVRDLKKGGTKETLDIKISDPQGIRPYELFSGGEAFRIDFALRIAIAKLLARRAGTALQTLIIDEGFGSQDEEGLSYIMDAIYTIQEDFEKVIIVSHLPLMKEQFPVHFVIEKGPQGSSVHVIENG